MQIYLSNSGQEPIYAQITRQIKQQILSGARCARRRTAQHPAFGQGSCASASSQRSARMRIWSATALS